MEKDKSVKGQCEPWEVKQILAYPLKNLQRRSRVAADKDTSAFSPLAHGLMHHVKRARRLKELEQENARLKREGWDLNRKRVQLLWRQEGLKVPLPAKKKRRLGVVARTAAVAARPRGLTR